MIKGIRMIIRDKTAFAEESGVLKQIGKPIDIINSIAKDIKLIHVVDLNAKLGNTTNFDLYNHMTYKINIEVEMPPKERIIKKLLDMKARVVLDLPCALNLKKFSENIRLLVGLVKKEEREENVFDYYIKTDDVELLKVLTKNKTKKRVLLYSNKIGEKEAENAGVFALIRDYF
ncbi:MAG: hypothetical protein AB1391_03820 [Candidatus Micrarchaeota archaeon]